MKCNESQLGGHVIMHACMHAVFPISSLIVIKLISPQWLLRSYKNTRRCDQVTFIPQTRPED